MVEVGVPLNTGTSCKSIGLSLGDFLATATGLSIAKVMPGMLSLVFRICVLGAVSITTDIVGFIFVVTDRDDPTLCPWGTNSDVG